ncbi:MAG: histidine phosphatase family protein, partial [Deltaproteobacteria bacterium]|nr:histidine phosphatase family protein [Deltaproteobacteria bacterium]
MDNKLYIVMVGLPARGKSTTATKIRDDLKKDSIKAKIFNNGDLRRELIPNNTSYAEFYNPNNLEAGAIREKISLLNVHNAKLYLRRGGQVAILDATNASRSRRGLIHSQIDDHPILYIECINNNEEILNASINRKVDTKEFAHLPPDEAVITFKQRISYYENIYEPLRDERNIIRLDSLNKKVIHEEIKDTIPYYDQVRDFLVTDSVKNLYLVRHGETYFNIENRIGGNSELTEKGIEQAQALGRYFSKKDIPIIFTSGMKRTIQTAEPIAAGQKKCTIIPLAEFNEIDSGICECMSYDEIRNTMPDIYKARKKDKYNYVYPEGEGYVTMKERINRGINKVLYLSDISRNIIIVGHRAANRMILSHFLFRREEDVPYIYIPQDKFYYISVTQNKKLF